MDYAVLDSGEIRLNPNSVPPYVSWNLLRGIPTAAVSTHVNSQIFLLPLRELLLDSFYCQTPFNEKIPPKILMLLVS